MAISLRKYIGPVVALLIVAIAVGGFFFVRKLKAEATRREADRAVDEAAVQCRGDRAKIFDDAIKDARTRYPDSDPMDHVKTYAELLTVVCKAGKKP